MRAYSFSLRPATPQDLSALQTICSEGNLALIEDISDTTVAVDTDDEPVGFIHIEHIADAERPAGDGAWVYPVAVLPSWWQRGVARALVEHAFAANKELRLVACRSSRGFYPKAGFRPLAWSRVASRIANDCKHCPEHKTCDPQPYVRS